MTFGGVAFRTSIAGVGAALASGSQTLGTQATLAAQQSADVCAVGVAERRDLRLPDGRAVWFRPADAAWNGREGLVVAREVSIEPTVEQRAAMRAAIAKTPPDSKAPLLQNLIHTDSLVGAILGKDRIVKGIPNPFPNSTYTSVRVAARRDGAWNVLFVRVFGPRWRSEATPSNPGDSVEILHGVLRRHKWESLRSIAVAHNGALGLDDPSDLVAGGDELAFAYAVEKPVKLLVLLHTRNGVWLADTLKVPQMFPTVILERTLKGAWVVGDYLNDLAATRFHSKWEERAVVAPASRSPDGRRTWGVEHPRFLANSDGTWAWWIAKGPGEQSTVLARVISGVGTMSSSPPDTVSNTFLGLSSANSAVALGSSDILWLFATGGAQLRVVLRHGGRIMELNPVAVRPSWRARAFAVSATEAWLVSDDTGEPSPTGPTAALLYRLVIRCVR